ncbi:MAG: hypothetical protein HC939_15535 [Pleurocapsa sp. SU_5_0]|nr:hypothetical protein [Pleurocapsa sp. SU_5_0]NJO96779.1 hypothetical protein [Pleurocapsa sp. CRU_1_2]NJR45766.1 hypothetical protein [Hyellaceae cyanobacterium CSU_1_1]
MNINRTHRLTIVDKKFKIFQVNHAQEQVNLKIAQKANIVRIISQDQKEAA